MAKKFDFANELKNTNDKLDKVQIQLVRQRLYLRATLPDKSDPNKNKQTRISTGLPPNQEGLTRAKTEAHDLQTEIYKGTFSWEKWGKRKNQGATIGNLIEKLREEGERGKSESQKQNFRDDYWLPWQRLPGNAEVSIALLEKTILRETEGKPRSRKRYLQAYRKLAEAARLTVNWSHLEQGSYEPDKPRNIPSSEAILLNFDKIQSKRKGASEQAARGWRWVYGIIVTFGLRPSEAFRVIDLSGLDNPDAPTIKVLSVKQKRGSDGREVRKVRTVGALPKSWVEKFDLKNKVLPNVKTEGRSNKRIGRSVSQAFSNYGIAFVPYDARHAYAIRMARHGVSLQRAAKAMGHSPDVHYKTYLEWIDEADVKAFWSTLDPEEQK
ncbi:MAG: tyrosine-type recombinase/integrase [Cyanobacteria bacterium P01_E01_bin.42]